MGIKAKSVLTHEEVTAARGSPTISIAMIELASCSPSGISSYPRSC